MTAVRSPGPGGQNVNKVASKVRLRVNLTLIKGMGKEARERLVKLAGTRLDAEGKLVVVSHRTRDQSANLRDARDKVREIIARALVAPVVRRATRPTPASVQRRIADKRRRGERKAMRRQPNSD